MPFESYKGFALHGTVRGLHGSPFGKFEVKVSSLSRAGRAEGVAQSCRDVRAGLVVTDFFVLFVLFGRHGEHIGCAAALSW